MTSPTTAPAPTGRAPEITAAAIVDLFAKLAPLAFRDGVDVAVTVSFEGLREKVTFALAFTDPSQIAHDAEPFLASIRQASGALADRLSVARTNARTDQAAETVSLEGMVLDASWPQVTITAEPCIPEDEYLDEEFPNG